MITITTDKHHWPGETPPPSPSPVLISFDADVESETPLTVIRFRLKVTDSTLPAGQLITVKVFVDNGRLDQRNIFHNGEVAALRWTNPTSQLPAMLCCTYLDATKQNWTLTARVNG